MTKIIIGKYRAFQKPRKRLHLPVIQKIHSYFLWEVPQCILKLVEKTLVKLYSLFLKEQVIFKLVTLISIEKILVLTNGSFISMGRFGSQIHSKDNT